MITKSQKYTVKLKILPSNNQILSIQKTMKLYAKAYNEIVSDMIMFNIKHKYDYHNKCYYDLRNEFPELPSQYIIRLIALGMESIKSIRTNKSNNTPESKSNSIRLDKRLYSISTSNKTVSVASVDGRLKDIKYQCRYDLQNVNSSLFKSAVLIFDQKHNRFYLNITLEFDIKINDIKSNILGIDSGAVVPLAVANDQIYQIFYPIDLINRVFQLQDIKSNIQSKDTRSSKRRLKSLRHYEHRLRNEIDHLISRSLVDYCVTNKIDTVIFEKLTNIRNSNKSKSKSKKTNRLNNCWSFFRLSNYCTYKLNLSGILVDHVTPYWTSIRCPSCGHIDKSNRLDRSTFYCQKCNTTGHADLIAAYNIRQKYLNIWNDTSASNYVKTTSSGRPQPPVGVLTN